MVVCHFEMFAVRVRCVELFSSLETSSIFEEEMATKFVEGVPVHTHFCQWLVAISLHFSLRKLYFNQKYRLRVSGIALHFVLN